MKAPRISIFSASTPILLRAGSAFAILKLFDKILDISALVHFTLS